MVRVEREQTMAEFAAEPVSARSDWGERKVGKGELVCLLV